MLVDVGSGGKETMCPSERALALGVTEHKARKDSSATTKT